MWNRPCLLCWASYPGRHSRQIKRRHTHNIKFKCTACFPPRFFLELSNYQNESSSYVFLVLQVYRECSTAEWLVSECCTLPTSYLIPFGCCPRFFLHESCRLLCHFTGILIHLCHDKLMFPLQQERTKKEFHLTCSLQRKHAQIRKNLTSRQLKRASPALICSFKHFF